MAWRRSAGSIPPGIRRSPSPAGALVDEEIADRAGLVHGGVVRGERAGVAPVPVEVGGACGVRRAAGVEDELGGPRDELGRDDLRLRRQHGGGVHRRRRRPARGRGRARPPRRGRCSRRRTRSSRSARRRAGPAGPRGALPRRRGRRCASARVRSAPHRSPRHARCRRRRRRGRAGGTWSAGRSWASDPAREHLVRGHVRVLEARRAAGAEALPHAVPVVLDRHARAVDRDDGRDDRGVGSRAPTTIRSQYRLPVE